jgi:hypothetical protein
VHIFLGLGSPIVVVLALVALALVSRRVCRICRRLFRATVDILLPVFVFVDTSEDSVLSGGAAADAGAATEAEVATATAERFEETAATMILLGLIRIFRDVMLR